MLINYYNRKLVLCFFFCSFLQEIAVFAESLDPIQLSTHTFHLSTPFCCCCKFISVLLLSCIGLDIYFFKRKLLFQMFMDFDKQYVKLHCQKTSLLFHHIKYNSYNTVNSEVIARFLLMWKMRQVMYRNNKNSHSGIWYIYLYVALPKIAII